MSASPEAPSAPVPTTDAASSAAPPQAPPPARGPSTALGIFLLVLLLLALALAAVSYVLWQRHTDNSVQLRSLQTQVVNSLAQQQQVDELLAQVDRLREQSQRGQQEVLQQLNLQQEQQATLSEDVGLISAAHHELRQKVEGSATAWRLDAVEQLLLLANERLQLAHDVQGAEQALRWADERLQRVADPGWLPVRQQIASETAALRAVPRLDTAAISLQLQAIAERVASLPLAGHVLRAQRMARGDTDTAGSQPTPEPGQVWYAELWSKVRAATLSLVTIRQNTTPTVPLLPPDQHGLLVQNLRLQLQAAESALLLRDAAAYESALQRASAWMRDYFNGEDPAVDAAISTLQSLRVAPVAPALPDISGSLRQLRSQQAAN